MTHGAHLGLLLLGKSDHGAQARFLQSFHGHDEFRVDTADDFPSLVLLHEVGKADKSALQYFDGGKSRDKHVHYRKRFYKSHSDLPSPDCPFRLKTAVGLGGNFATVQIRHCAVSCAYPEQIIKAVTPKAQVQ